jgi:hypothetical protein
LHIRHARVRPALPSIADSIEQDGLPVKPGNDDADQGIVADRMKTPIPSGKSETPPSARVRDVWYGVMALGGLAFGLIGERRPFGDGILAHPLVALFIVVAVALIVLRVVLARPVPEVISDRSLLIGCFAALAAFLVGNFVSAHLA